MATFLFDKIIFGPVSSRRLGVSLGINLLPVDSKLCTFDCIYCECGRNPSPQKKGGRLPDRLEVKEMLERKLIMMKEAHRLPDVITFAGNGEPTLHPRFPAIIDDTLALRDRYAPASRIAVLSNATMLHRPAVFAALLKVDDNIQKLDSANEETLRLLDCPVKNFNLGKVVEQLKAFNGNVTIQTMFVKGTYNGRIIDNTTDNEVEAWLDLLKIIKPGVVMIYTIDRDTPVKTLGKIHPEILAEIARKAEAAGVKARVSD